MAKSFETQRSLVKKHLEDGKSITPYGALTLYGSLRLSAIIFDLKKDYGMDIVMKWGESIDEMGRKKRYGVYFLKEFENKFGK